MISIMSEVSGAAASAAGLILVFFGAALAGFDSYSEGEKTSVRAAYRWRAWPTFLALTCATGSCALALYAKASTNECAAFWSVGLLSVAGIAVLVAAVHAVMEIG